MLIYVAAGDSLTAGVGAQSGMGLVPQYRMLTAKYAGQHVKSSNHGISGATTGDILKMLQKNERVRSTMAGADIITLTAGGNDLIQAAKRFASHKDMNVLEQALTKCHDQYADLIETILKLKGNRSRRYIIRAADLYNPLPDMALAVHWVQRFNQSIQSLENDYFKVAPVYASFAGRERELLSYDGVHPNSQGYRVIAEQMSKLGYRPLL
ncbi:GDSL-type esterase/lipase family protein [Paenibacillus cremeus]|uniref:GDSL family lipase n=1 Tax=Paenibacillus cremeus TaxID=2163881 RepID=A0A559JVK1_9BACL|nr:GDSL-type esterase/lipase family protein [Paenibacillus cremeus]TVY03918.1 GDSL family lipase [Paenibacillus cremeus]